MLLKMMKALMFVSLASILSAPAIAFNGFSRACKWTDMPVATQVSAASAFQLTYNGVWLPQLPASVQRTLVAQESITVNYGNTDALFLIAFSTHYARNKVTRTIFREAYYISEWDESGYWDNNRGFFFAARAGFGGNNHNLIFEPKSEEYDYVAVGTHGGWNGVTQQLFTAPRSVGLDCNCTNWGFDFNFINQAGAIATRC